MSVHEQHRLNMPSNINSYSDIEEPEPHPARRKASASRSPVKGKTASVPEPVYSDDYEAELPASKGKNTSAKGKQRATVSQSPVGI